MNSGLLSINLLDIHWPCGNTLSLKYEASRVDNCSCYLTNNIAGSFFTGARTPPPFGRYLYIMNSEYQDLPILSNE